MRRNVLCLIVPVVLAVSAASLMAQSVRGRVVEEDSDRPVSGAIVTLLTDSTRFSPALTEPDGSYQLIAPGAGRYRLRVDLIGYQRWISPEFMLAAGETRELNVNLPLSRVRLETLIVRSTPGCRVLDQQSQSNAGMIWEEIRRALTISGLTQEQARLAFEWRITERERVLHGRIHRQQRWSLTGSAVLPWTLRPPALLAEQGWVLPEGDSIAFYGPGSETLLSPEFIASHCFEPVRRRGHIGLAFSPVASRQLPDIAGTIWLDARSSELRTVEFTYRNLPPHLDSDPPAGGELTFARLPTGQWYVRRWMLRMPLAGRWYLERVGEAHVQ